MPDRPAPAQAPPGCPGLAGLLARATVRTVLDQAPGKSGARLERVVIGGQPYVLKRLDLAEDWTMRASGCLRGAPLELWERGSSPACPTESTSRSSPPRGNRPAGGLCRAAARALVQFGWEEALAGYDEELRWWERLAIQASAMLP